MSQDKRVVWDYSEIQSQDNLTQLVHLLSERDVQLFAAVSTALFWQTRWLNVPNPAAWDALSAYIDDALKRLYFPVDLCELINQCVAAGDVPAVTYGPVRGGSPVMWLPPETTAIDAIPDVSVPIAEHDCDLDALWAGIREMIERIDQEGRDLLEDLAAFNDKIETVQRFIDLVPIFGDTIADLGEFLTETIPDLLNAYNAHSSPSQLDAAACDLFELCCEQCRYPTYNEVLTYFFARSVLSPLVATTTSRVAIWNLIKGLGLSPIVVWYSINALQVWVLSIGSRWANAWGRDTLRIWATFGEEFANDNWQTLCGGCAENIYPVPANGNAFTGEPPVFGIEIPAGAIATVEYVSGEWNVGGTGPVGPNGDGSIPKEPASLVPTANVGALVGWQAGDPVWRLVGDGIVEFGPKPVDAILNLAANEPAFGPGDNAGELLVRVTWT